MHRADGFFHVPRRADDSLLPLPRIERTCPTQPRQFHADARPGLADLIVQFAADQPPLVFVRREPLPGQQPHFLLHELRLIEQHRSFLRALPEGELPGPPRPDRALKPAITPEQRDRPPLPPIFLRLAVATRLASGPMQPLDRRERRAENAGPAAEPGTQPGPFPARSPRTPGAWSCSRTKSSVSKPCAITSRPLGRRLPPRVICDGIAGWAREPIRSRCDRAGEGVGMVAARADVSSGARPTVKLQPIGIK